jgi:hypothetical protein
MTRPERAMFDVPLDAWVAWVGLAIASVAVVGVVATLPTSPPPDAAGVAETVDRVATAAPPSTAEHPLDADRVRLTSRGIGLESDGGRTHATFAFGPVTPVAAGSDLTAVLYGDPPERAFDSRLAFQQAVVDARATDPGWQPADRSLVVRRVGWQEYHVTLVGA